VGSFFSAPYHSAYQFGGFPRSESCRVCRFSCFAHLQEKGVSGQNGCTSVSGIPGILYSYSDLEVSRKVSAYCQKKSAAGIHKHFSYKVDF
jgi:hypothetical protein